MSQMNSSEEVINEQELRILDKKGYRLESKPFNRGSFATVFKATNKQNGTRLAVKVINCDKVSDAYKNRFLPRELYVLKKLKHPFIIGIYEILTINNKVFIVMELAEGGDLVIMLKTKKKIEESKAKVLFKQISEALNYIHSEAIAHRDIKCENILLINKSQTIAKLADFGFARTCYDNSTGRRLLTETQCGSLTFVGPELLNGQPFDAMINDCWSIGVVLYCMVVGKMPFSPKLNAKQLLKRQMNRNFDLFELEDISSDCKDIISKLLDPNVKTRLNMKQVLNHKWIKDIKL